MRRFKTGLLCWFGRILNITLIGSAIYIGMCCHQIAISRKNEQIHAQMTANETFTILPGEIR